MSYFNVWRHPRNQTEQILRSEISLRRRRRQPVANIVKLFFLLKALKMSSHLLNLVLRFIYMPFPLNPWINKLRIYHYKQILTVNFYFEWEYYVRLGQLTVNTAK